ncbi:MAG: hypothetical protein M1582_02240 [Actinobacteria bacterium]|nr:hypothetical protein [Actinomycetota bacterium]
MRILAVFLTLTVVSLAVIGFLALSNIAAVGSYGLQSSVALGDAAVQDSTSALETLGEEVIKQKATDVGRLVEVYIRAHPAMTLADLRGSDEFRRLAVQPVGETGYTALLDMGPMEIVVHKFPAQEGWYLGTLEANLPRFWSLLQASTGGREASGYYDWREVDGSITRKYAYAVPIAAGTADGVANLELWATTCIGTRRSPL